MGDDTTAKIDRFFNLFDATVDEATRLLTRGQKTARVVDRAKAQRQRHEVIDVDARAPRTRSVSKVRIIESIDAMTSETVFVVTDGVSRSECPTREAADRIARAMETA